MGGYRRLTADRREGFRSLGVETAGVETPQDRRGTLSFRRLASPKKTPFEPFEGFCKKFSSEILCEANS